MEVKKSQHKYVIGPKGNSLQEILERTGVSVEMPPSDSISETVILRGEPEKLGQALTEVYAKVSAPPLARAPGSGPGAGVQPRSTWWGARPPPDPGVAWLWPLCDYAQQTHRPPLCSQANSFAVSSVSAPSWLHRFIIGKKGQNLARITQQMPKVRAHHRPAGQLALCCAVCPVGTLETGTFFRSQLCVTFSFRD